MKRDPDFFGDREVELVYIGKRLKDALRLEDALTGAKIDYTVQTETYHGGIIFRSERVGAFFYVDLEAAERARGVVSGIGLKPYLEEGG
ncbi:MAG: hypothetical protein JSU00_10445 [Acidobacteria bacterium]|nr:hypothetical protein [Acidobacteriota bacterium]